MVPIRREGASQWSRSIVNSPVRGSLAIESRLATIDHRPSTTDNGASSSVPIQRLWLNHADSTHWEDADSSVNRLAAHVDIIIDWGEAEPSLVVGRRWSVVDRLASLLAHAMSENPSTLFDCYLIADTPPQPGALRDWRAALPYRPGYLDRVAIYRRASPEPGHERISPRLWLVLPWTTQAVPEDYAGVAEIIWMYDMAEGETPPFGAWAAAGGAGVWVRGAPAEQVAGWRQRCELRLWSS